jgi:hypothetical protein
MATVQIMTEFYATIGKPSRRWRKTLTERLTKREHRRWAASYGREQKEELQGKLMLGSRPAAIVTGGTRLGDETDIQGEHIHDW